MTRDFLAARSVLCLTLLGFFDARALPADGPTAAESSADLFGLMYWTDRTEGIYRAARDGSEMQLLLPMPNTDGLTVDDKEGKIYFTLSNSQQANGDKVMRANLDGSNPQELATLNFTGDLVLDPAEGGKVYVSSLGDDKIVRLNRDGTGLEDFIIGLDSPDEMAFDPVKRQLYWANGGKQRIERANLDGKGRETVIDLKGAVAFGLALDPIKREIYWLVPQGTLSRAALDGSNEKALITGLTQPDGLAFDPDNRKLYWTENGKLSQANADGSQVELLVAGKTRQYGSVVILPPK
jgi:sugar lactone lactonase YvrE